MDAKCQEQVWEVINGYLVALEVPVDGGVADWLPHQPSSGGVHQTVHPQVHRTLARDWTDNGVKNKNNSNIIEK